MPDYGNQFDENGQQYIWNSHSLKAWEKCERYYQLSILEGWRPKKTNVHFAFGAEVAKACQTYYLLRADGVS